MNVISVPDAIQIIDAAPVTPRVQRVRLDLAQGLRLAQDIRADRDYPPFDKSLMDGYAVRCVDVTTTPVELQLVGEIAAGKQADRPLQDGEAMAIMTGAPMPPGVDGVVPVEDCQPLRQRVRILRAGAASQFVAPRGADCPAGAIVLHRGTRLDAAQLAVAASVGASQVDVFARPRVAVLSTGDELVGIDSTPGPTQIRSCNNLMLTALLGRLGCDVTDLGMVRDDPAMLRDAISRGLKFDVLLVSGGMSMGRHDYVPKVLAEMGVELKITKLRIKPGKPFIFGMMRSRVVFGLPGNPVSAYVCMLRLCSRVLVRMAGGSPEERWITATLASPLEQNGDREFCRPAVLSGAAVRPLKWKGSGDIFTLASANCLIVRPANEPAQPAGASVKVLEFPS